MLPPDSYSTEEKSLRMNALSPYFNDMQMNDVIDGEADGTKENLIQLFDEVTAGNRIIMVKTLRAILNEKFLSLDEILGSSRNDNYAYNVKGYLIEARFWLGWELNRIKLNEERSAVEECTVDTPKRNFSDEHKMYGAGMEGGGIFEKLKNNKSNDKYPHPGHDHIGRGI